MADIFTSYTVSGFRPPMVSLASAAEGEEEEEEGEGVEEEEVS